MSPPWPTAFRALVGKKRTLMMQGPMGRFFNDLAQVLMSHGQEITKVHFNGGDQVFWHHPGALRFNGRRDALEGWLRELMCERCIDALVVFGQMRRIHQIGRRVAQELGVSIFVFEEGYLRPDYVTIERRGVNALSRQPRVASFYTQTHLPAPAPPRPTGQSIWRTAWIATVYSWAVTLLKPWYWRQTYHRRINPVGEALRWIRGAWRHQWYRIVERGQQEALCGPRLSHRWFLVPLQVRGDSQVRDHSRFKGMEDFLIEVMTSFATQAPPDVGLIIKHHPMDRAYTHYGVLIQREARRLRIESRVKYLHDQHLPTLLEHTRGVITINSTVGLQALHHNTPVITLGESVYCIPGLVYGGTLASFWHNPGVVDAALYRQFRHHLIAHTQLNASFYADVPAFHPMTPARHADMDTPDDASAEPWAPTHATNFGALNS